LKDQTLDEGEYQMKIIFNLDQNDLPKRWYNIQADLDRPLPPPLDPRTREPLDPAALRALFAGTCIDQEMSTDRYIDIPAEVLDVYRLWRGCGGRPRSIGH
jgi:tryptophan synthase beta chain